MNTDNKRSFVLLGNVDHGKSTLAGRILVDCNCVGDRELEKIKDEADKNKMSSWWLAYILDTDEFERMRGKTQGYINIDFNFQGYNMEMIDVPGHKQLVKEMAFGCSLAQIGVLLTSARQGEYEDGLKGQTLEHAIIAKGMGISSLVVVVNKMDSINWDFEKYQEIVTNFTKKLKKYRFEHLEFVPISAYDGCNVVTSYSGQKSLMDILSQIPYDNLRETVYKTKDIEEFKDLLICKFLGHNIPKVLSAGIEIMIHTKDQLFSGKIVKVKNGNFPFLSEANDTKKAVDIIIKLDSDQAIEEISSNLDCEVGLI
jgi:sulfate adenylyltransferase subunit 1 (EFTu-like GTPase family)